MDEARAKKRVLQLIRMGLLEELRDRTGLSQADVARAIPVNQSTVSRWESGKAKITAAHAVRLLELIDVED